MTEPQAGATRFAHLLRGVSAVALAAGGRPKGAVAGARADDDEDMKEKGPQDEGAETEDTDKKAEDGGEDGKKGKKGKKAKKKAEDEGGDDEGEEASAAAKDDDEEDDGGEDDDEDGDDDGDRKEMRRAGAVRLARMHERGRCAAIFADAAAARNPALAASLAFETDLPRKQAIAVLRAGGAAPGSRLAERMAGVPSPRVGADGPAQPKGPAAIADKIVKAYEQARGLTKQGG